MKVKEKNGQAKEGIVRNTAKNNNRRKKKTNNLRQILQTNSPRREAYSQNK